MNSQPMGRIVAATLALGLAIGLAPQRAKAGMYLGPSPYQRFADSPFNGTGFSYFFLEDFEDGALNTTGVLASAGAVLGPGPATDSVDGDDGAIDGSGAAGHSFLDSTTNSMTFTFDATALGGLPTHAGLVWTDVGAAVPSTGFDQVTFEAFDAGGNSLGAFGPSLLGDGAVTGETAEDRFFGAVDAGGISAIRITMATSTDWEIDHLQYGLAAAAAVPEPSTLTLAAVGALALAGYGRRRRLA